MLRSQIIEIPPKSKERIPIVYTFVNPQSRDTMLVLKLYFHLWMPAIKALREENSIHLCIAKYNARNFYRSMTFKWFGKAL